MISIFFILNRMKIGNDRRAELGAVGRDAVLGHEELAVLPGRVLHARRQRARVLRHGEGARRREASVDRLTVCNDFTFYAVLLMHSNFMVLYFVRT